MEESENYLYRQIIKKLQHYLVEIFVGDLLQLSFLSFEEDLSKLPYRVVIVIYLASWL